MDFANFTMVPKWVLVLTKAKLLGHNTDSTKPPQWLAMGPKGAKGKTNLLRCCPASCYCAAVRCRLLSLWPGHTHTQTEGMCADCSL